MILRKPALFSSGVGKAHSVPLIHQDSSEAGYVYGYRFRQMENNEDDWKQTIRALNIEVDSTIIGMCNLLSQGALELSEAIVL